MYLLRKMCFKYLEKGGQKLLKADRYDQLIDQVLGNRMVIADVEEIELANQLLIIKKINIGRLFMELKELKEFGKEVGLKLAQMNKMSDDGLVLEVIRNVEPKIQYSKELVAWYNELDDSLFDQAEAESGASTEKTNASGDSSVSIDDVAEAIAGYTKKADLLELLADNDVAPLFTEFDASAYKLPTQLKKAMVDFLTAPPPTEVDTKSAGDDQLAEAVELINDCENEDQLVEVYSEYQGIFGDMEVPDDVDVEVLQTMMLDHIKSKAEPEVDKPMSLKDRIAAKKAAAESGKTDTKGKDETKPSNEELFNWWSPDADGFIVDDAFAEVEKLKMTDLRKFAKFIGLTIGIGKKKDEILDLVAGKIAETVEGADDSGATDEITVTAELINDAAKGKDRDSLVEMCDLLKIKLNALQKKSVPGMQKKLLAAIESKDTTGETATVKTRGKLSAKTSTTDAQSVYGVMEQLVVAGKSEDAVLKAVSSIYKEKGKSIIFIKKRVHTMFEIIKTDNDMD
jgi:hypothetical protein